MNLRKAAQQALDEMLRVNSAGIFEGELNEAIDDLRQALAEPEQPVAIKWTLNGDKHCSYANWLGETLFGRILITWKSWKDFPDACVDEFPGGFEAYGDPDEVKAQCEAEFCRRLGTAPTPRKPDDDEVEQLRALNAELVGALKHAAECVQTNYLPDKCGHDWDDVIQRAEASNGS